MTLKQRKPLKTVKPKSTTLTKIGRIEMKDVLSAALIAVIMTVPAIIVVALS